MEPEPEPEPELDPLQSLRQLVATLTSDDTSDDDYDSESDVDPVLVIDSGDFTVKAGIAGDDAPLCEFAALVVPDQHPEARKGEMPRMEDVRKFYRDPQAAQTYTGALIRSHQLLSLAKLGHPRLFGSGLSDETSDDDVMAHIAHFVRQSAVEAHLLVGCETEDVVDIDSCNVTDAHREC